MRLNYTTWSLLVVLPHALLGLAHTEDYLNGGSGLDLFLSVTWYVSAAVHFLWMLSAILRE